MLALFRTAKTARQVKVLIVDDDASVRETIQDRLQCHGWDIMTAADGHEALTAATQNKPDLMLLDIHMPCMDGLAALECLRRDPKLSDVPVVMVTRSSQPADISKAASYNVVDYVTKPFNIGELVVRIQQVIGQMKR